MSCKAKLRVRRLLPGVEGTPPLLLPDVEPAGGNASLSIFLSWSRLLDGAMCPTHSSVPKHRHRLSNTDCIASVEKGIVVLCAKSREAVHSLWLPASVGPNPSVCLMSSEVLVFRKNTNASLTVNTHTTIHPQNLATSRQASPVHEISKRWAPFQYCYYCNAGLLVSLLLLVALLGHTGTTTYSDKGGEGVLDSYGHRRNIS